MNENGKVWIDFAEVKQKVSIPECLEVFGIAEQFEKQGEAYVGACPLPKHVHNPVRPNRRQFRIDRRKGEWLYICFSDDCGGAGGDVIKFVQEMLGCSAAHARLWFWEHFRDRLGGRPRCPPDAKGGGKRKEAREVCGEPQRAEVNGQLPTIPDETAALKPLRFRLNLETEDVPYLRERDVPPEVAALYGLGMATRGLMKGFLAIPVYGYPHAVGENPLAYIGRFPGEDYERHGQPRYRVPEGFPVSRIVYGLPQAMSTENRQPLIVVEGPFDVFRCVQAGHATVVALLGSSLSDEQADLVAGTGRDVILFFDGDQAGRNGAGKAVAKLVHRCAVRVVEPPGERDPADLTPDELNHLLASL